jgi:hypothetical protein
VGGALTLTVWDEPRPRVKLHLPRVEVRLPPIDEVGDKWHHIAPLLAKATSRTGCYEPIDLLAMAMRGQVGIWVCEVDGAIEAAVVTEIKQYPRRRILEVLFAGGTNMRAWLPRLVEVLDEHGEQAGCSHVASAGRRGWAKAWGATPTGDVVLVRDLAG